MKSTAIETIRVEEHPNLLWVEVHTDEGLVVFGETFYSAAAVEAHIHEIVAPQLIGADPAPGHDDLNAFLTRADELAIELLESGITVMKIWPFDPHAKKTGGLYISAADMKIALEPFEKIRKAVGDKIDIMVEFHWLWQLTSAIKIAEAFASGSLLNGKQHLSDGVGVTALIAANLYVMFFNFSWGR